MAKVCNTRKGDVDPQERQWPFGAHRRRARGSVDDLILVRGRGLVTLPHPNVFAAYRHGDLVAGSAESKRCSEKAAFRGRKSLRRA